MNVTVKLCDTEKECLDATMCQERDERNNRAKAKK